MDIANETINELNKLVATQRADIKLLKYSLNASTRLCVSKDLTIEKLKRENNQFHLAKKTTVHALIFNKFEQKLEASILKALRSVPTGQRNDSSFVLKLVRHLYEKDFSVLFERSAGGKNKTAITPTKKNIINEILRERVITEEEEAFRAELRINRVDTLINDAIKNIVRPLKKPTNISANTNTNTNSKANTNINTNAYTNSEPPPLVSLAKKRKLI